MFSSLRRRLIALPLLAVVASACNAEITEGEQYVLLDPPVEVSREDGKIEVREFFWYGCGHCYKLEAEVEKWKPGLADDVAFIPTPGSGEHWDQHARVFYGFEALDILDKAHRAFYDLIHIEKGDIADADQFADFVAQFDIEKEAALDAYKSFAVDSKVRKGRNLTRDYQVSATPTVIVDGRYIVNNRGVSSYQEILEVADELVEKVRSER